MSGYTPLTQQEQYQIYILMKAGHDQGEIAAMLSRHKSTISREICRNRGRKGYGQARMSRPAACSSRHTAAARRAPPRWVGDCFQDRAVSRGSRTT